MKTAIDYDGTDGTIAYGDGLPIAISIASKALDRISHDPLFEERFSAAQAAWDDCSLELERTEQGLIIRCSCANHDFALEEAIDLKEHLLAYLELDLEIAGRLESAKLRRSLKNGKRRLKAKASKSLH